MAKRKVMAENAARGQEKQDQIVADVGPTIVKNLILGGGILGTLDAATIPRQGGEVLLVSMPAPSDRPVMQTDGSIIASNTRQQRMDPWSTYGDLEIGQTGYQLLPYNADVNGHPILGHDGKPIPDPGLLGMTIQPVELQSTPEHYTRSSELSLATAETARQSGVPFIFGMPVSNIQLASDNKTKTTAGWPLGAKACVEIKMLGVDGKPRLDKYGKPIIKKIFSTETIDVCIGPGSARKLRDQADKNNNMQISPEDATKLEASGAVVYAEEFLGGQWIAAGQNILVFGGGDTGACVIQTAFAQQRLDGLQIGEGVEWAARPDPGSRPAPTQMDSDGKETLTRFGELDKKIKDYVNANPGNKVPRELTTHYNEQQQKFKTDSLKALQDNITILKSVLGSITDPEEHYQKEVELQTAQKALEKTLAVFNAFGDEKPRYKGTAKQVVQISMDILRVTPIFDGKVLVTYEDGSWRTYDKVICSIGQDPAQVNGPKSLVADLPLVLIMEGNPPYPVGLQTPDGAVRIMGASAWQVRNNIMDDAHKKAYEQAIDWRSRNTESGVSHNSFGVLWGFETMGDNPARANKLLSRSGT
jgi:hypothetical protein